MLPDPWPRRPPPETTGPRYECEISRPAELRTVRAGLRTWLPDALVAANAAAFVTGGPLRNVVPR